MEKELVIIGMAGADETKNEEKKSLNDDTLIKDAFINKNLALERDGLNSVQWIINQYISSGLVKEKNFYVAGSNNHFNGINLNGANFFDVNVDLVTNALRTLDHVLQEKEDEIKSKNKELWIGFQAMDTLLLEEEHVVKYLNDVFNLTNNNEKLDMIIQSVSKEAAEKNNLFKFKPDRAFLQFDEKLKKRIKHQAIYGGLLMMARPSTEDRELLKTLGNSMYYNRHDNKQILKTAYNVASYLIRNRYSAFSDLFMGLNLIKKDKMRKLSFDYLSKVASQIVYQEQGKVKVFCVTQPDVALGYAGDFDRVSDVIASVSQLKKIRLNENYLKENYQ